MVVPLDFLDVVNLMSPRLPINLQHKPAKDCPYFVPSFQRFNVILCVGKEANLKIDRLPIEHQRERQYTAEEINLFHGARFLLK